MLARELGLKLPAPPSGRAGTLGLCLCLAAAPGAVVALVQPALWPWLAAGVAAGVALLRLDPGAYGQLTLGDLARETAARVLRKDPASITPDERSMAKMVNFGLAYGMSDFGLASRAGIPRQEAREFIDSYFSAYSGIAYYMLHIKDVAREQGYVETLLGRRRWIPELSARNATLRGAGERMAINMPIQGTAADIMKIALIRLHDRLTEMRSPARMLLSVHDEVLLEVPRDGVDELAPVVHEVMADALRLDVPLDVDVKVGEDWESMTRLDLG